MARATEPGQGPHNLHDREFKLIFGAPEAAFPILRAALPEALALAIDEGSLAEGPTDFVNDELDEDFRDLLFTATVRGKHTLFYFLEHQRGVDPFMPLRVLRYVLKVWDWWRARNPTAKTLPAVVPVVLHQSATPWTGPWSIAELIDLPADVLASVARYLPALELALEDLGPTTPPLLVREFPGPPLVRVALAFMRWVVDPEADLSVLFLAAADAIRQLVDVPGGPGRLKAIVRYTVLARALDWRAVMDEVDRVVGTKAGDVMRSAYEEAIDQGVQRGLRRALILQLEARFGALDRATTDRIDAAAPDHLSSWLRNVLTASTVAAVFGADRS